MSEEQVFEQWLEGRPEAVKTTAHRFPPGSTIQSHERTLYVVGYSDEGGLLISETNPAINYELAVATRCPVCQCCVEKLNSIP